MSDDSNNTFIPKGFDWDYGNIGKNWNKHNVTNKECEEVFFNKPILFFRDGKHTTNEVRYIALGITNRKRFLALFFTGRHDLVRIISARPMSRKERSIYGKEKD